MPAIDHCEPAIVRALQRAGWLVTHQPFPLSRQDRRRLLYADLRLQHREHDDVIIVVEVKCFATRRVFMADLYHAVGQYVVYRNLLRINRIDAPLYLALPLVPYERSFQNELVQSVLKDVDLPFIVIDLETEEVVQWIMSTR